MRLARWLALALVGGCVKPGGADAPLYYGDSADSAAGDSAPGPKFLLIAGDPAGTVASAWIDWFTALAATEVHSATDDPATFGTSQELTVLLPDLPRNAKGSVAGWTAGTGNVLAMGVGGAHAYDGLGIGIGYADGGQGAVDGLSIADGFGSNAVFAGVDQSAGPIVTVWQEPVTDVGIVPVAAGLEVLGWDDRYPGSYADLCHIDRYWFWGWGDTDGTPDRLTADGGVVFQNLVGALAP